MWHLDPVGGLERILGDNNYFNATRGYLINFDYSEHNKLSSFRLDASTGDHESWILIGTISCAAFANFVLFCLAWFHGKHIQRAKHYNDHHKENKMIKDLSHLSGGRAATDCNELSISHRYPDKSTKEKPMERGRDLTRRQQANISENSSKNRDEDEELYFFDPLPFDHYVQTLKQRESCIEASRAGSDEGSLQGYIDSSEIIIDSIESHEQVVSRVDVIEGAGTMLPCQLQATTSPLIIMPPNTPNAILRPISRIMNSNYHLILATKRNLN